MTYEVQQTRWDRLVRRVSGSIGPGSRVSETISELFPVLEVERLVAELFILSGTRLCWQSTERPPSVGEVTSSQLINPADSGTIITISRFDVKVIPTSVWQAQITDTLFTVGLVSGLFRDGRLGTARETTGKVASVDNVPTGGGLRVGPINAQPFVVLDENSICTLAPGQAFQVGTVGTNIVMTVNYYWRERAAEPSELQF